MSVNKAILVGRLGADPEMRQTTNGVNVATLKVATSESFTDKEGKRQEKTEWHRVVAWDKLATLCGEYLSKGSQVYLEGSIQTRKYEDKNGVEKYSTEVVARTVKFLSTKGNSKEDTQDSLDDIGF